MKKLYISRFDTNVVGMDGMPLDKGFSVAYEQLVHTLKGEHDLLLRNGDDFTQGVLQRLNASFLQTASGYLFLGKPDAIDTFLFYMATDAAQTRLPSAMLHGKDGNLITDDQGNAFRRPIGILNIDDMYTPILDRFDQLDRHGLMKAHPREFIVVENVRSGDNTREAVARLIKGMEERMQVPVPLYTPSIDVPGKQNQFVPGVEPRGDRPVIFTCCSFSTKSELFLTTADEVGKQLALAGYDIMGGGGRGGMMERIQKNAQENGAHVTGITFPSLNAMVPDYEGQGNKTFGISLLKRTDNMAHRLTLMTEGSDGVLIAPGGLGTDTEAIGPVLIGKRPIVILNMMNPEAGGERCHDGLIHLLETLGKKQGEDFHVVNPPNLATIEETARNAAALAVRKFDELTKDHNRSAMNL